MGYNILLIEYEPTLAQMISFSLRRNGFGIRTMEEAAAIHALTQDHFDLVLLDVQDPGRRGLRFLSLLRKQRRTVPVIILSEYTKESFIVRALRSGADDVIKKPFGLAELVARMEAVLRHYTKTTLIPLPGLSYETGYRFGEIDIYPQRYEITCRGERMQLRTKEFDLFFFLLKNREKLFTKDQLLDHVWQTQNRHPNLVNQYIALLRQKIKPANGYIQIQWLSKHGYRMIIGDNVAKKGIGSEPQDRKNFLDHI
ncbi:response regulator transcription factor [Paenibacillus cymbidii]|uniref:response regulator transcription factor n=1 Tax=Paenibacillus cymbidii TaxID=1639034 RepID=UPI0010802ABE|nr:response regulator transcription factor [Paenibacillus cymbidii]